MNVNELNGGVIKIERSLDVVFCMGFTQTPALYNEKFANFLLSIKQEVEKEINGYSTELKRLRVKIINFSTYSCTPFAITESPFFTLVGDNQNHFNQMMDFATSSFYEDYDGQGTNGLEALDIAMRAPILDIDGENERYKKIIVVLTDAGAKQLGQNGYEGYPQNAPKNVKQMVDWWKANCKNSYIVFATPTDEVWKSFNANEHCFRFVINDFFNYANVFDEEMKKLLVFIANV